jgi:hypothetical protein
MTLWIYKNIKNTINGKPRTIIHKGECGHCKDGSGVTGNGTELCNGEWIGPINFISQAEAIASNVSSDYRKCDKCKPR